MVTEMVTFPRKERWSHGRAGWRRDAWSWMKCREAALGILPSHLGLGQKGPGWELSIHLVALWRGRNTISVVVKLLSSTGESLAILSPGCGKVRGGRDTLE